MAGKAKKEVSNEIEQINENKILQKKSSKKTYKQLRSELRKLKDEIEVEIMNLDTGTVLYRDRDERLIFEMNKAGEKTFILLSDLYEISNKHRGYFENYLITIIDVDSDDYTVEDILEYLNLKDMYEYLDEYDLDYINHILLKLDNDKFVNLVEKANYGLIECLGSRVIELYKKGKFDSHYKEHLIATRLGLQSLFED
ncbi:hypothetical protein [Clostridioides difficile]|uniref:Uncharacterized protein n=1 Tax=Clostridioides difficile TaxID=1496 RepID=A0A9X8RLN9_CLODI|nr:hypothetical protein [Clostridioides difficile]AUO78398.1 hypothetical protein LIBA2945_00008 [Clostridioides phage LIBA2945]EGT4145640.1 hypothetical protein [Clostridioides difficile]EGT4929516.1 hypothetical protein [Clostridioides difficile]EGT5004846.1 hypothetical protein [Clostridioides difficile]EKG0777073.1 hypothetical protein [Clostridioides difficile]